MLRKFEDQICFRQLYLAGTLILAGLILLTRDLWIVRGGYLRIVSGDAWRA